MSKLAVVGIVAAVVVVFLVIMGFLYTSIIPKTTSTSSSPYHVKPLFAILDSADTQGSGVSGQTYYIVDINISYTGSGSFELNPYDFYLITNEGTYQSSVYPPPSGVMKNPLDQIVYLTSNEYYNGEVIFKIPATATPEYIEYMTLAGEVLFKVPAVKPTLFYIWIGDIYLQSNDTLVFVSSNSLLANLEMFSNQTLTLNISATNYHFITPVKLVGVQVQGPSGFKVVLPQNEIGELIQPGQSVNLKAYLYAPANYTGYVNQITITLEFQDM